MILNKEQFRRQMDEFNKKVKIMKKAAIQQFGIEFAKRLKDEIPEDAEHRDYRDGIEVKEIERDAMMQQEEIDGVAVVAQAREKVLGDLDKNRTVLRFEFSEGGVSNKVADVLVGYGPWAIDIVPNFDRLPVVVYYQEVSPGEVNAVRGRNKKIIKEIGEGLTKEGVVLKIGGANSGARVFLDVKFKALRMEYGLVGERMLPHWRKTYRKTGEIADSVVKRVVDDTMKGRAVNIKKLSRISISEVKSPYFQEFAKRLIK